MATTDDLTTKVHDLSIADAPDSSANPWQDQANAAHDPVITHGLKTPDPAAFEDELAAQGAAPVLRTEQVDAQPHVNEEVLSEFDPLVDGKEAEAREAWASVQGNPMPPKSSTPPPESTKPQSDDFQADPASTASYAPQASMSAPSPGLGFPSLASLARSFSLPKVRTRSVDITPPFSLQQPSRPSTPVTAGSSIPVRRRDGSSDGSSRPGTASPRSGKERGRQKDEPPPFDFQLFLDQMKVKSAEPVARYLRSFLSNFAKKPFPVNEQIKVINEFLNFIAVRMREAEVWRNASDIEFDNAMEAMEKLVMNRLYEFTFTPQLAEAEPPRPVTTDDLERDRILAQRVALFGWIEEKHLDVPEGPDSRGFLMFAQQELLKINHYKAPRDKLICVLNCCKVIFGLIRHLHKEENADSFVPILIFIVLKANPPNLISNIEYIQRFRNPQKLQSEAGYYLSSLMGAVQFIETMDHTGLSNITADDFERYVEDAIHDLPASPSPIEKPVVYTPPYSSRPGTPSSLSAPVTPAKSLGSASAAQRTQASPHAGEESAQPLSLALGGSGALADETRRFLQRTGDTLSKPLSALGRILGEALDGLDTLPPGTSGQQGHGRRDSANYYPIFGEPRTPAPGERPDAPSPIQTPYAYKPRVRPGTPGTASSYASALTSFTGPGTPESASVVETPSRSAPGTYPSRGGELGFGGFGSSIPAHLGVDTGVAAGVSRTPTPALDIAGLQDEIDVAHERAASAALGTLMQIFPGVDREVVEWVLEAEGGDLGRSIEKLLEVGGG
ncbi:hypothetical protein DFH11DRAFT_1618962 [Phellopilus nigrolimitatus]|nr:hypothetical protein DFH11DRAFT_1618962 [Phellopilus nigrolimitatus]